MTETYTLPRLLALRKLTRAMADLQRGHVRDYLGTLVPLLRPKTVLGDYIGGSAKGLMRAPEKAFQDLQRVFQSAASVKPFSLTADLTPPFEDVSASLEIVPLEYIYTARTERDGKSIEITSPLKWVLYYSGYPPSRLKELLAARARDETQLRAFVLHYAILHVVVSRQPGIGKVLEGLRFPLTTVKLPEFGELPLTCVASPVGTLRPPDSVIIESTELSGQNAFEEIVDLEGIKGLRDPLREKLAELARNHGEDV